MDYRRFGKTLVCRIDRGEEVIACLEEIAKKEMITMADIRGIGATNDVRLGAFSLEDMTFKEHHFTFSAEILSLLGSITTKDGEFYPHLHISICNEKGECFGGHVKEVHISVTCELFITEHDGQVDRKLDPVTGINIFDFEV